MSNRLKQFIDPDRLKEQLLQVRLRKAEDLNEWARADLERREAELVREALVKIKVLKVTLLILRMVPMLRFRQWLRGAPTDTSAADPQPPKCASFILRVLAKSPAAAESTIGDMHERFARDCAKYGVRRARLYCWADTLRSLWPLFWRALGRAMKWAAIMSAVKRYFTG